MPPSEDAALKDPEAVKASSATSVVVSAVGDCTLASNFFPGGVNWFAKELAAHEGDLAYPFSGVHELLAADDLTIANLEMAFTRSLASVPGKTYHFAGKPEHAGVLSAGSVEVVNVANNHSDDFGKDGLEDTVRALSEAGVAAVGEARIDKRTVKGIEIVNLGFMGGLRETRERAAARIRELKTQSNVVVVSFHWGTEGTSHVIEAQTALGHAAVDAGADLVLGTHPHVLQGIETYKGRHIVYSLGNFVYGGHPNPTDKDTIVYQESFALRDGAVASVGSRIWPARMSTAADRNDFRPVLLEGEDRERVLSRLNRYSAELGRPRSGEP